MMVWNLFLVQTDSFSFIKSKDEASLVSSFFYFFSFFSCISFISFLCFTCFFSCISFISFISFRCCYYFYNIVFFISFISSACFVVFLSFTAFTTTGFSCFLILFPRVLDFMDNEYNRHFKLKNLKLIVSLSLIKSGLFIFVYQFKKFSRILKGFPKYCMTGMLFFILEALIIGYIYKIIMDKPLKKLRDEYKQYYNLAHTNTMKTVKIDQVKNNKNEANGLVEQIQANGQFQYLEEADFYRDKFGQLQTAFFKAKQTKMRWADFNPIIQDIFSQKQFIPGHSYIKNKYADPKASMSSPPKIQNKLISSFFQEKKSKLVPEVGFRSILENPPVASKAFKKKTNINNQEIDRLRNQNYDLKRKLESGEFNNIETEKLRKQEQRIHDLQVQNNILNRDNQKLRSQKSMTSSTKKSNEDYMDSPYIMQPRENDLYKINVRNYSESEASNNFQYENQSFSNTKYGKGANFRDTFSNNNDRDDENYSVFDLSRSYCSDQGDYGKSSKLGIENSRTIGKNKNAFFKKSGILMREDDIQIAYKRSEPQYVDGFSKIRINLYYNNKTDAKKYITTFYDFEGTYYQLEVVQKIYEVNAFSQGRQVIQIRLQPRAADLNSVIQAIITIDGKKVQLWMPALFIKFSNKINTVGSNGNMTTKTIYPHRYFKSKMEAKKVIEEGQGDGQNLRMWGISKFGEGSIELSWKSSGKLDVRAPEKWVDILSFIMFDFK